jgi:hypothetical protein
MLKTVGFPSTRTGDQTIVDGNLVIGTSGKGIDFSATPGTGTSELLNDYEEGTFTPTITASSGTFTTVSASGTYTKIGRQVTIQLRVTITDAGTAAGAIKYTLPFTSAANTFGGVAFELASVGMTGFSWIFSTQGNIIKYDYSGVVIANGNVWDVTATYFV